MTSTEPPNQLFNALGITALGVLVGQVAVAREIPPEDVSVPHGPALPIILEELMDLGIDPPNLARGILRSYASMLMEPSAAEKIQAQITSLLWSIMGDPIHGGNPPEIYHRAGAALHVGLLSMIDPEIVAND